VISPVRVCALVLVVVVALARRRRDDPPGVRPLLLALAVAAIADAGLPSGDEFPSTSSWQIIAVVAAYPFWWRGLLAMLSRRLPGREADVLVEACLAALAVAVLCASVLGGDGSAFGGSTLGLPLVIVTGLDAVLVVVAARLLLSPGEALASERAVAAATVSLFAAHASVVVAAGTSVALPYAVPVVLAIAAVACLSIALVHPSVELLCEPATSEIRPLSRDHVAIVVAGMLVAPAAVAFDAAGVAGLSVTTAVAIALLALVFIVYVVGLLVDRASKEHRVHHDDLTGLPNRTLFHDRLARALAHGRRNDQPVGVLFIDLDRFKEVNDTFGHPAGDELLRAVAARLRRCLRDEDTLARLAGDEFAVLLPHLTGADDVLVVAERLMAALAEPVAVAEVRMVSTASIGVAVFPVDGADADELVASADAAMYRAKENGRNGWALYSAEMATRAHERLRIETALHEGLRRDELVLHYQPIVELATNRIVGAEALVRWDHPERGLLLPGHFVPVAERSDLVVLLGERVVAEACDQLAAWADGPLRDLYVTVNVSARHFRHGLAEMVAASLRRTGVQPARLVVELTESAAADNLDVVATALDELHQMGARAYIDDFGTGYCGLRYLSTLPVDGLKIDRSFIQGMSVTDASIVAATIAMGHSLGLTIVAEGVETEEQGHFLAGRGCDLVQGYLLGRPMPADQFAAHVLSQQASDDDLAMAGAATVPPWTLLPSRS
jgi:diguanylate cyclase (GGDEF)-like protein